MSSRHTRYFDMDVRASSRPRGPWCYLAVRSAHLGGGLSDLVAREAGPGRAAFSDLQPN